MSLFEELHFKMCLQLYESKFDIFDIKEYFYTFLTSRGSCHNCQNSLTSDLKV